MVTTVSILSQNLWRQCQQTNLPYLEAAPVGEPPVGGNGPHIDPNLGTVTNDEHQGGDAAANVQVAAPGPVAEAEYVHLVY